MTRDSLVWTISLIAAVLTLIVGHVGLLHTAFPTLTEAGQARIELVTALVGFVAGWLKMSPLPLSPNHPLATGDADVTLSPINSDKPLEKH